MRVPDEVTLIQLFLYALLYLIHLFHPHSALFFSILPSEINR